jgi:hypothetical protein
MHIPPRFITTRSVGGAHMYVFACVCMCMSGYVCIRMDTCQHVCICMYKLTTCNIYIYIYIYIYMYMYVYNLILKKRFFLHIYIPSPTQPRRMMLKAFDSRSCVFRVPYGPTPTSFSMASRVMVKHAAIRKHLHSAYVSIRQHTSAYVSIRFSIA